MRRKVRFSGVLSALCLSPKDLSGGANPRLDREPRRILEHGVVEGFKRYLIGYYNPGPAIRVSRLRNIDL